MTAERFSLKTPIGFVDILTQDSHIAKLTFSHDSQSLPESKTAIGKTVKSELEKYFKDPQYTPNIPYKLGGTPFQQSVWQALKTIPTGNTNTYGELAKRLKSSPRAIGQACRTNPLPLIIPCHRIIAANNIGGFVGKQSGKSLDVKAWLLKHEGSLN